MNVQSRWEVIDGNTDRLWVPFGWIVRSTVVSLRDGSVSLHQIFVQDPMHTWTPPHPPQPNVPQPEGQH